MIEHPIICGSIFGLFLVILISWKVIAWALGNILTRIEELERSKP